MTEKIKIGLKELQKLIVFPQELHHAYPKLARKTGLPTHIPLGSSYLSRTKYHGLEWHYYKFVDERARMMEYIVNQAEQQIVKNDKFQSIQFVCPSQFDFNKVTIGIIHNIPSSKLILKTEQCNGLRANGMRCTRRKKNGDEKFCGTHIKGTPHGTI